MVLAFFCAKVAKVGDGRSKKAEVYLKHKSGSDEEDLINNEAVLTNFCFPLGPDAVAPKEYMASEVTAAVAGVLDRA